MSFPVEGLGSPSTYSELLRIEQSMTRYKNLQKEPKDVEEEVTTGFGTGREKDGKECKSSLGLKEETESKPDSVKSTVKSPALTNPKWFEDPRKVTELKGYSARYDWLSCREFLTIVFSYLGGPVYRSQLHLMSKPSSLAAYDSKCRLLALDLLVQRLAKADSLIFFKGPINYLTQSEVSKLINPGKPTLLKRWRPRASGGWSILKLILNEQVKIYLASPSTLLSKHRLKSLKMCSYHASYTISQLMATQRTPHNASLMLYYSYKWYLIDVASLIRKNCFDDVGENSEDEVWGFTWCKLREAVECEVRDEKKKEEVYGEVTNKLVKASVKSFAYLNRYWVKQRRAKSLEMLGKECFECFGYGEMGREGATRRNFMGKREDEDPMMREDWKDTYNMEVRIR